MPDAPPAAERRAPGRHLPTAIAMGVALAAVFLGSLAAGPAWFSAVVVIALAVAVLEAGAVLSEAGHPSARPVLLASLLVCHAGAYLLGAAGQVLGLLVLVVGGFAWELASGRRGRVLEKLGATALLGLWTLFLASFAILLVTREGGSGAAAVVAVLGGAIFGDIGAYAVGRAVGRFQIAPRISPNKTWEGLLGGVAVAAGLGAALLPVLDPTLFAGPAVAATVAGVAALAGFFGDLIESMIKRDAGVKDLGSILPGHGGMLDRIDGLLLALPVGHYALELLA